MRHIRLGVAGMSTCLTLRGASAFTTAFITEVRAGATCFPASFRAERIAQRRRRQAVERQRWRVARSWQRIVHKRTGQQLPVVVVDGLLHERLANALDDPAMRLAFDEFRIDQHAEVAIATED